MSSGTAWFGTMGRSQWYAGGVNRSLASYPPVHTRPLPYCETLMRPKRQWSDPATLQATSPIKALPLLVTTFCTDVGYMVPELEAQCSDD